MTITFILVQAPALIQKEYCESKFNWLSFTHIFFLEQAPHNFKSMFFLGGSGDVV